MFIESFSCGPISTNAYVVACTETQAAAIIDAPPSSLATLSDCITKHALRLEKLLLTHSHWDHTGDVAAIKKEYGVPVYVHEADAANVRKPGADGLPMFFPIEAVEPDHFLAEGDVVELGNLRFEVIHTPGHSPGGICFYEASQKTLICGDTLFQGSIGNLSLPTADSTAMWPSLDKLAKLPPQTRVYPGHGPSTTIGDESWLPRARLIFGGM